MKVLVVGATPEEQAYLAPRLAGHEVQWAFHVGDLPVEAVRDIEALSVFIYSRVSKDVLERMPALRFVCTRSTGFDHIDAGACAARGIPVANVPYYGENTVAEHTFALILNLARHVHKSYVRHLQGNYSIEGLRGSDLKDKTLGVIGAGHIGLHVIRIAKGFGMHVLAYDPYPNKFIAEILHYRYAPLDEVLAGSDIITLHVPARPETYRLINADTLKKVKKGAILINTARGSVVDTAALLAALEDGTLSGAGLDVLEGEEAIKEEQQLLHDLENPGKLKTLLQTHLILKRDNVVFTPHNAFNSKEAVQRILDTTVQNLEAFAAGTPINVVKA